MGFWKDGKKHGYGQTLFEDGTVQEGLFEHGEFKKKKTDIKTYNPNIHTIA